MMFFIEPEHSGVHRLMRHMGYRPYAIFPGPDLDTLAVVVRTDQPACLLIQQTSAYGWVREAPPETVETNVSRLHQEGQALAERLGCPVACLIIVYHGPVRGHRWHPMAETASQQQVTPVLAWKEQWPTELIWIQPTTRVASPPLPPYPQRTHWSAHTEPSWWLEHLRALNEADDRQRKKQARFLAGTALI